MMEDQRKLDDAYRSHDESYWMLKNKQEYVKFKINKLLEDRLIDKMRHDEIIKALDEFVEQIEIKEIDSKNLLKISLQNIGILEYDI